MATNDTAKATEELREDLDKIRSELAGLVEAVGKFAADGRREGLRALDGARTRAQAQAAQSLESIEQQVAEKPLVSMLIAFAVGMVFGKLIDRR